MKEIYLYTAKQKLDWFGPGAWVEEPDEVDFIHAGFTCKVHRVIGYEKDGTAFGGHLCGYVKIPSGHPWYSLNASQIECDVHGGVTFKGTGIFDDTDDVWIGFDCAHYNDIIPCMKNILIIESLGMLYMSYKTITYAIGETQDLAEQAVRLEDNE